VKKVVVGFAVLAAFAWTRSAVAQGAPGTHFGLSGGADFPVSDQSDVYKTGWNGTGLVAFNFGASPFGMRIDGSYHELRTKDSLEPFFGGNGKTRIIDGTLDVVIGPHNMSVEPYFIGGGGVYDLRFSGEELDTGNSFSASTTRFGWNAGGGIAFPLSHDWAGRMFIEARYTSVSVSTDRFSNSFHTGGSRFTFVPVNIGIIF
jgi:opacity protein-like surface antigen